LHELLLLQRQEAGANQACDWHPVQDPNERDNQQEYARTARIFDPRQQHHARGRHSPGGFKRASASATCRFPFLTFQRAMWWRSFLPNVTVPPLTPPGLTIPFHDLHVEPAVLLDRVGIRRATVRSCNSKVTGFDPSDQPHDYERIGVLCVAESAIRDA
jgi:hypothetical protein